MRHNESPEQYHTTDIVENTDDAIHLSPAGQMPVLPEEVTEEVIRFYSPLVYRLALTRTQSTEDAEDIFQEVFLKLVSNRKPFETEEHRKAWIIRVTINCCNSHFVAPWRKNVTSMDDVTLTQLAGTVTDEYPLSEEPDIYSQVLKLPKDMRDVILLFYYEDMSIREISQILKTSETNIKKRLSRARSKLRLELEDEERKGSL